MPNQLRNIHPHFSDTMQERGTLKPMKDNGDVYLYAMIFTQQIYFFVEYADGSEQGYVDYFDAKEAYDQEVLTFENGL